MHFIACTGCWQIFFFSPSSAILACLTVNQRCMSPHWNQLKSLGQRQAQTLTRNHDTLDLIEFARHCTNLSEFYQKKTKKPTCLGFFLLAEETY